MLSPTQTLVTAWKDHYKCLLHIELTWNPGILEDDPAVEGSTSLVTQSIVVILTLYLKLEKFI